MGVCTGEPSATASATRVCAVPAVLASACAIFGLCFSFAAFEVMWQPWLVSAPWAWDEPRVASLPTAYGALQVLALPLVGLPFHRRFGDMACALLGIGLAPVGLLFIGEPPLVLPRLALTPWLPCAALGLRALLAACAAPLLLALPLRAAVHRTGMAQEEVALPVGLLCALMPYAGYALGPLVGEYVVRHHGVRMMALVLFGVETTTGAAALVLNYPLLTRRGR
jgi:hypothetical protein